MTNERKTRLTVISNNDYKKNTKPITNPLTKEVNPYLQKLLQFSNANKQKKFSIEDLLKW